MRKPGSTSVGGEVDLDTLQRLDPRLVALAHGQIDDDELDELLERAIEEPEVRRAVEAFWPLSDEVRERSFDRARAALAAQRPAAGRRHVLLALPAALAVFAAGVFAWVAIGVVPPAPLPPYELEVRGGYRTMRADPQRLELGRMTPDAPLELVFRPADPISGLARAALFSLEDGGPRRLDVVAQTSASGAVRWRGTVEDLLPDRSGPVELVLVVQPGEDLPTEADVGRALGGERGRLRWARTEFVVERP